MRVVCFAGYSGSGKTTLVEGVIAALKLRGLRVSVVKHAHHQFDIAHPGKDTWRHREAGAFEVIAASDRRMALMREFEQPTEPTVHQMLAHLDHGVDWVLVEGFKQSDLPKVEVWRADAGQPARYMGDERVLAIATDDASRLPEPTPRPLLDINDHDAVAQWLVDQGDRFDYAGERRA